MDIMMVVGLSSLTIHVYVLWAVFVCRDVYFFMDDNELLMVVYVLWAVFVCRDVYFFMDDNELLMVV
jgi:hypothetical protein